VLFCHLVNDSSLRGGFLLNFLDDGQGMTQGKITKLPSLLSLSVSFLHLCLKFPHVVIFHVALMLSQRVIAVEVLIVMMFTSEVNVGTLCGISSH